MNTSATCLPTPPAPAQTTALTWDDQAVVRLVGDRPAMQQRLLLKFLSTSADTLAALRQAGSTGDWVEVGRHAHSLKSAARSVGAMALGDHCWALEQAAKATDVQQCHALCTELPVLADRVSRLIGAHLQSASTVDGAVL